MFLVDSIVLKKKHLRDNSYLVTLYTKDYGKITCFHRESRKFPELDVFCRVQARISVKSSKNTLQSCTSVLPFDYQGLSYVQMESLLWIAKIFDQVVTFDVPNSSLYFDFRTCLESAQGSPDTSSHIYEFAMKLIVMHGISESISYQNLDPQEVREHVDRSVSDFLDS